MKRPFPDFGDLKRPCKIGRRFDRSRFQLWEKERIRIRRKKVHPKSCMRIVALSGRLGLGLNQTLEHMHKEVGPSVDIILASFQRRAKKSPKSRRRGCSSSSFLQITVTAPKDVLALAAAAACGFKVLFLTEQAISRASFLVGSGDLWQFLGD